MPWFMSPGRWRLDIGLRCCSAYLMHVHSDTGELGLGSWNYEIWMRFYL